MGWALGFHLLDCALSKLSLGLRFPGYRGWAPGSVVTPLDQGEATVETRQKGSCLQSLNSSLPRHPIGLRQTPTQVLSC
jgi:hypothetical protein